MIAIWPSKASEFGLEWFCARGPKGFAEAFDIFELRCERGDDDAPGCQLCRARESVYSLLHHGPPAAAEREPAAPPAKYPQDSVARYHRTAGLNIAAPRSEGKRTGFPFLLKRFMVRHDFAIGKVI